MPHSTSLPPGTIEANINYYNEPPLGESYPVQYVNSAGSKRQKWNAQNVWITDLRTTDNNFGIHQNGFQFLKYPGTEGLKYEAFSNEDNIKTKVYEEVKDLLRTATGATDVHIFNHIIRRDPYQIVLDLPADIPDRQKVTAQHPAMLAHVDQSNDGARMLVDLIQSPEAKEFNLHEKSKRGRWGLVNVWKPLRTVTCEPLAVCDGTTVPDADLRPVTIRISGEDHPDKTDKDTELWYIAHNTKHKWYWPSNMEPDEALLIKCFDSKTEGVSRRAPHSAFRLPNDQGPPRESIEVRCVVFWDD